MIPIFGGLMLAGFLAVWIGALVAFVIALILGIVFTVQYRKGGKNWKRVAYIVCYICAGACFLFAGGIILFFQLL